MQNRVFGLASVLVVAVLCAAPPGCPQPDGSTLIDSQGDNYEFDGSRDPDTGIDVLRIYPADPNQPMTFEGNLGTPLGPGFGVQFTLSAPGTDFTVGFSVGDPNEAWSVTVQPDLKDPNSLEVESRVPGLPPVVTIVPDTHRIALRGQHNGSLISLEGYPFSSDPNALPTASSQTPTPRGCTWDS